MSAPGMPAEPSAAVTSKISCRKTAAQALTIVRDGVHFHDLHATILHLLGLDHTRLTYRHAGRDYRLTDVDGTVLKSILA